MLSSKQPTARLTCVCLSINSPSPPHHRVLVISTIKVAPLERTIFSAISLLRRTTLEPPLKHQSGLYFQMSCTEQNLRTGERSSSWKTAEACLGQGADSGSLRQEWLRGGSHISSITVSPSEPPCSLKWSNVIFPNEWCPHMACTLWHQELGASVVYKCSFLLS